MDSPRRVAWSGVLILALSIVAPAAAAGQSADDLRRLTLEDLMNLEVTTVSRTPQPQVLAPAAVSVITQDEIRRSGATSLPELLRLVPGVQVARIDSNKWAIGIRGFADRLSRSVLVLIDGRPVYSPLFAGTYWEAQETLLEDVDRIEVVRGPGGTLWGANAVNGVINIITKNAADTEGTLVTASAGTEERAAASVRYGGRRGDSLHYRVYGKGFARDAAFHPAGPAFDDWRMGQAGFRADATLAADRTLTVQGDWYDSSVGQISAVNTFDPPSLSLVANDSRLSGGNATARWRQQHADGTGLQVQMFYDRTRHDELTFRETRQTADVDFQQAVRPTPRQLLIWGAGYRVTSGATSSVPTLQFTPNDRTDQIESGFVQDELTLAGERVRLTVGSKIEHNDYSGVEVQPSASAVVTASDSQTLLVSVTRAVRTPSRVERDLDLYSYNAGLNAFLHLEPNPDFDSETLVSYEGGYRVRMGSRLFTTLSLFLNQHHNLLSTEFVPVLQPDPNVAGGSYPILFGNGLDGESHGAEISADLNAASRWRWRAGYSFLRINLHRDADSHDVSQVVRDEGGSPRHQFQLQSMLDLPGQVALTWSFRAVSALPAFKVPRYATSDVNVTWSPSPRLDLSLVGQDLPRAHHLEFEGGSAGNTEIQRSVYGKLTLHW